MKDYEELEILARMYKDSDSDLAKNNYNKCAQIIIERGRQELNNLELLWLRMIEEDSE